MRVNLTKMQKELLIDIFERGIISFTEAKDRGTLKHYQPLKALKLVTTNQDGIIITKEGIAVAFRRTPTL